ncbi:distal tail protein Dit [Sutcliffiella rhizosphaerae]|uniref:Phage tail protein n=1 Tax=Sutcliffiella rhizosphaerae TaxID=2880967 RepID=A0ABN8A7Q3_9BACI|nr:distal tail protein Dit [Sutcliffiella rhizosphaerae]CAG9621089.1 hypothetical protein BACCIP111883_01861 [Sutcliffiella rhizosphaerae]
MITFNGTYLGDLIKVTEIGGRGPIGQTSIRKDVPGKNGTHFIKTQNKERVIPISFYILSKSLEELRNKVDEINYILATHQEVPITFSDEPDKTYFGSLDGDPDWEEIIGIGKGQMTFVCSDSKKMGKERIYTLGNQFNVVNNGTADAYPLFDINVNTATDNITISCNSKSVRLLRNFLVGDLIQLDFKKRKVFLNNAESGVILDWSSKWFVFVPGSNTITITPNSGINGNLIFHERWL